MPYRIRLVGPMHADMENVATDNLEDKYKARIITKTWIETYVGNTAIKLRCYQSCQGRFVYKTGQRLFIILLAKAWHDPIWLNRIS